MSVVTSLLVSYSILEERHPSTTERFRSWFEPAGGILSIAGGLGPDQPALWWGGPKNPECTLWGGAYNHLDIESFWIHMNSLSWTEPRLVQVFVQDQEDLRFQIWMIPPGAVAFEQFIDGTGEED